MGAIAISNYPILVELIHNDVPVGTIDDGWGEYNVYEITSIHYLNRTSNPYLVNVTDPVRNRNWDGTVNSGQDGTINLPPPRRFNSAPIGYSLTFVRA